MPYTAISVPVKVTYQKDGQEVIERYSSLYKCSKVYPISVHSIKKLCEGHTIVHSSKQFLNEMKFSFDEVKPEEVDREKTHKCWTCEICHLRIWQSSKFPHLNSVSHKKKMAKQSSCLSENP